MKTPDRKQLKDKEERKRRSLNMFLTSLKHFVLFSTNWLTVYGIVLADDLGIPSDAERKNTHSCVVC